MVLRAKIFRATESGIFFAVKNHSFIDTVVFKQCVFLRGTLVYLGFVLNTNPKMKHVKNITLSNCNLNDNIFEEFCLKIFNDAGAIHYLKIFDVSSNYIEPSTIVSSLRFCIIEKLVISDYKINNILVYSNLVKAFYENSDLLNFIKGAPLIIINKENEYQLQTDLNYFVIFIVNCKINYSNVHLNSEIPDYQFTYSSAFVLNSLIEENCISHVLSSLKHLMDNTKYFNLFGNNLSDKIAGKISVVLNKPSPINTEYFLISDTDLFTKLSKARSISTSLLIDIMGCNVLFGLLCKLKIHKVNHIKELDISAYQLNPFCVDLLIKSFQSCSFEELTLQNDALNKISDAILDAYSTESKIKNFSLRMPFAVIGRTEVNGQNKDCVTVFCINICHAEKSVAKLSDLLISKKFTQIKYVLLNFFTSIARSIISANTIISKFLTKDCHAIVLYEVGLHDTIAANIVEHLKTMHVQVLI